MEYCKVWHQFLAWNFPIFQKCVWGTKISARQSLHFTRSWLRTTMWFKPLKDQSDIIAVVGQTIVDRVAGPGKIDKQPCHPVWPCVALRRQQNAPTFFFWGVQKYPLFTKSLQKHRQEYVVIPYTFYDGTDDTRKNAFRVAVQRWHANTCVALVEQNQADITRPYIKAEFCGGWVICKKLNLDQTVVERGFVGHEIPS